MLGMGEENCVPDARRPEDRGQRSGPSKSYTPCKATAAARLLPFAATDGALGPAPLGGDAASANAAGFIMAQAECLQAASGPAETLTPGSHAAAAAGGPRAQTELRSSVDSLGVLSAGLAR